MRHQTKIIAIPSSLRFSEERGYELIVKVSDGPQQFVGRHVSVKLDGAMLDKIAEWEPKEGSNRLELSYEALK